MRTHGLPTLLILIFASLMLLSPPVLCAQPHTAAQPVATGVNTLPDGLQQAIDSAVLAELERQGAVGIAIGVIREGQVAYTAGYGMADRETGTPVDSSTLFRWASISKPLTAVAAMQLVEAGRLDLDADVRTLVPEFSAKATPIGTPVTMRQLLAHLGGIVHYSNGPVVRTVREYEQANPYQSVILALDTFAESPLVNQPGKKFAYTTHGYILASAVVERAGGAAYADQVIERICKPLGLTTLQPDYQWISIPDRAVGYRKIAGVVVPTTNTDVSWKLGGGGWISNIHDLAAFGAGMLGDAVLSAESRKTMWTRQQTIAGEQLGYGLGWDVSEPNERLRVAHNGSQEKTQTRLVLYPDDAHGIAVMTNSEYAKPGAITTAIYRAIEQWEVQQP